jgi:hypothetical protein
MCRTMRKALVAESKRRRLPVWAFLLLINH